MFDQSESVWLTNTRFADQQAAATEEPEEFAVDYVDGYSLSTYVATASQPTIDVRLRHVLDNVWRIKREAYNFYPAEYLEISVSTSRNCKLHVIGGGGGGSADHGGGGGAGTYISWEGTLPSGIYGITIGRGGSGGVYDSTARDQDAAVLGGNTTITHIGTGDTLTAYGGQAWRSPGSVFGSGCGTDIFPADYTSNTYQYDTTTNVVLGNSSVVATGIFSTGYSSYANNGGQTNGSQGSGGGGAGSSAPAVTSSVASGGDSIAVVFSNDVVVDVSDTFTHYFGGGGGGGGYSTSLNRDGGLSSGGAGGHQSRSGVSAVHGTGGGGGGGGASGTAAYCNGGDGGDGVVFFEFY